MRAGKFAPMLLLLILLLASVLPFITTSLKATTNNQSGNPPWWDERWLFRRPIIINNTMNPTDLRDYQLLVNVTKEPEMKTDYGDIRFVWYNSTLDSWIELPYWIEIAKPSYALVWVKVPIIPANSYLDQQNTTLFMYWGNPVAESKSDGNSTFIFFDDFEDGDIDEYSYIEDTGTIEVTSEIAYSGIYSLRINDTSIQAGPAVWRNGTYPLDWQTFGWVMRTNNKTDMYLQRKYANEIRLHLLVSLNASGGGIEIWNGTFTFYEVTGVQPDTWYYFEVDLNFTSMTANVRMYDADHAKLLFSLYNIPMGNITSIYGELRIYTPISVIAVSYYDALRTRRMPPVSDPITSLGVRTGVKSIRIRGSRSICLMFVNSTGTGVVADSHTISIDLMGSLVYHYINFSVPANTFNLTFMLSLIHI